MKGLVLTISGKKTFSGESGACVLIYSEKYKKIYRLVSNENGDSIPFRFLHGINKFDDIEFKAIRRCPIGVQNENLLIDLTSEIKRIGSNIANIDNLEEIRQNTCGLLKTYCGGIFGTRNYYLDDISYISRSYEIIKVRNLKINTELTKDGTSKKGKAEFVYLNKNYKFFAVTDFDFDIRKESTDVIDVGAAYLIVSIPNEPYTNGKYYKFIAAIYPV